MIFNNYAEVMFNNCTYYNRIEVFDNGSIKRHSYVGYHFKKSGTLEELKDLIKRVNFSRQFPIESVVIRCHCVQHEEVIKELQKLNRMKQLYKLQNE